MAYLSSKPQRETVKHRVLSSISTTSQFLLIGRDSYRIGGVLVHTRFCSPGKGKYKFNINPNSLRSDYELWICGTTSDWYLIPTHEIRKIYNHPRAYPDGHHPNIRVVSVDVLTNECGYASPGVKLDLSSYFRGKLP
jgi:hypothetical protein